MYVCIGLCVLCAVVFAFAVCKGVEAHDNMQHLKKCHSNHY